MRNSILTLVSGALFGGVMLLAASTTSADAQAAPSCGSVAVCTQKALEVALEMKRLMASAVPSGAVMAFNLTNCPDGWRPFDGLRGRVALGQSDAHKVGETGGSETHTLTVEAMPSHNHETTLVLRWGDKTRAQVGFSSDDGWHPDPDFEHPKKATVPTSSVGGGQPFDTMPPFYTLLYCERV